MHIWKRHKLRHKIHRETETLNITIINKETELIVKNAPPPPKKNVSTKERPGPYDFIGKCYSTFKELKSIFHKLFQNIKGEKTLSDSFCKSGITVIPKPKISQKRKLKISIL